LVLEVHKEKPKPENKIAMHIAMNAFIVFEELHSVKRLYRKNSKQMIIFSSGEYFRLQ
jgi:hypothetical protein